MQDRLIYGKNETTQIVSIEPTDSGAEVFIETNSGIKSELIPNRYWVLANNPIDSGFIKLSGSLHYKYGKQFTTREEYITFKKQNYKRDIFSIHDSKESLMVKDGLTYYKGMQPKDVSILSFDIETTTLNPEQDGSKVLLISNTLRKNGIVSRKLFAFTDHNNSSTKMILEWAKWVKEVDPSIICGHNIYSFDLKYLSNYLLMNGEELCLGRNGSSVRFEDYESRFRVDGTRDLHYNKVRCYGRELIDTMFLAYKYDVGRKYESYGLKKIIAQENLEANNRVFYDASKIRENYKDPVEWEKIKEYCEHDSDDALKLFDLMSPPFFYMTQSVPKSFQAMIESASGSQINSVMVRSYLQEKHSVPKASNAAEYEGAISFGNPGIYRNVFKVDVASLYPSIMIEYEVHSSEKDPNKNFLTLVKTFTERRLYHKSLAKTDKYHDDMQAAFKIFINSCYGFLGSTGLNFNMPEGAAFITRTGRDILLKSIEWAQSSPRNFKIVNADTDSISFTKPDETEFSPEEQKNLLQNLNSIFPKTIHFEDDGSYNCVIVFKAKNYVLYDGKKIKTKGSAIKATTKEPALREFINKIIGSIIDNKEDYSYIYRDYVKEAYNILDIKRWVTRKTISEKTLNPQRTNEEKIFDIIKDTEYSEGDRIYCYFKSDGSLSLAENFDGDYDRDKMLEKLFKTAEIFDTVLPMDQFKNYKLKRNKKELLELLQ